MQHLVVEGGVDIMDHLIRNDTVEEVARDGKHVRCVAASSFEMKATEFHLLVDMHMWQQANRGVLRQMQRSITCATLIISQWKYCVLGTASRVHARDSPFLYK